MTPFWPKGEPIALRVDEAGQPAEFVWTDGRTHRVTAISRCWRIHTAWWREREIERRYWELTTDSGYMCVVFLDVFERTWFMERIWK